METANKTIELVSKRSLTCKQASFHWPLNLSSAGVKRLSPLNSVPWVATRQVVCYLGGPTVCVQMPGEGSSTGPRDLSFICHSTGFWSCNN